jgi:hypothetical protein
VADPTALIRPRGCGAHPKQELGPVAVLRAKRAAAIGQAPTLQEVSQLYAPLPDVHGYATLLFGVPVRMAATFRRADEAPFLNKSTLPMEHGGGTLRP